MRKISTQLEVTDFEVFGGAGLDLLRDPDHNYLDLDLAIRGDAEAAQQCRDRLVSSPDVGEPTPVVTYWVHLSRPVATFDVRWRDQLLDISFMDHTPQAHFDLETVVWHYPTLTYTDPYRVAGRPVSALRLVTSLDAENPVLLLNRVLKLAAKYRLDLAGDRYLDGLIRDLLPRVARWRPDDDFHGRQAHDRHLRHLHASISRAENPAGFLRDCLVTGILGARLPRLATELRRSPDRIDHLAAQPEAQSFWAFADAVVDATTPNWRTYEYLRDQFEPTDPVQKKGPP